MNPYKMFKNDPDLESQKGIILDYGEFKIRIARAGGANTDFNRSLRARIKPYKKQIEHNLMDNDLAQQILAEVYADSVILNWSGVTDEEGNELEFTRENVIKVLTDLPELFNDIQAQAQELSNFRELEIEDEAKNLKKPSGGKSSGGRKKGS